MDRSIVRAAQKYGPSVDHVAKRYGLTGAELLVKLVKGESGGSMKSVSPVGARGAAQFMPSSRNIARKKYGIDPWRSVDEALHGAALHLRGKINGKSGLEGYNPGGGQGYVNYIKDQKIGSIGSGTASASIEPVAKAAPVANTGPRDAVIQALLSRASDPNKPLLKTAMYYMQQQGSQPAPDTPTKAPRTKTPSVSAPDTGLWSIAEANGLAATGQRARKYTSSGNISDHWNDPKWVAAGHRARDYSGSPKAMRKTAYEIAAALGIKNYKPGKIYNVTRGGYRYQLIYGTSDHLDHVHLGRAPA